MTVKTTQIFSHPITRPFKYMVMSYKSPLGRIVRPTKYKEYNSDIIPEFIRLPDGREVSVKELTRQARTSKPKTFNRFHIKKPQARKPINLASNNLKYSISERIWQANATVEQIQSRYAMTPKSAYALGYQARTIVKHLKEMGKITQEEIDNVIKYIV